MQYSDERNSLLKFHCSYQQLKILEVQYLTSASVSLILVTCKVCILFTVCLCIHTASHEIPCQTLFPQQEGESYKIDKHHKNIYVLSVHSFLSLCKSETEQGCVYSISFYTVAIVHLLHIKPSIQNRFIDFYQESYEIQYPTSTS